ncbi:MAG TPA: hypothetical protein ENN46_04160 [Candidatus Woesearchaeota archaeon]|nr:hypothetical protein [Candidatus Woesearchaeota archaeon]
MDSLRLLSSSLKYYSRHDVQEAIAEASFCREAVPKILHKGSLIFGKRPSSIAYPADVLAFAKQRATSFHISEERWKDPMSISSALPEKEFNRNRIGWDLILDIDFPFFEASKLIAHYILEALYSHGIKESYVKFSGNKGFHIAVPFESFPAIVHDVPIKDTFPELPLKILKYLSNYIDNPVFGFPLSEKIIDTLPEDTIQDFVKDFCLECGKDAPVRKPGFRFICAKCGSEKITDEKKPYLICASCEGIMNATERVEASCALCGSSKLSKKLDLGLDSVLISKRHLFRSPYSLHEKSMLVSVPIEKKDVLSFDKNSAMVEKIVVRKGLFLPKKDSGDRNKEAFRLFREALDYDAISKSRALSDEDGLSRKKGRPSEQYEITSAVNESHFPPCIAAGLKGLKDGKKRFVFILIKFLKKLGWDDEKIREAIVEWNTRNPEKLSQTIISTQLKYHLSKDIMPPNCAASGFYLDMMICNPDSLCAKIKNPVIYSLRSAGIKRIPKSTGNP